MRKIKFKAWHKRYKEIYEVTCIDWEAEFVWVKYYDDDREEWFSREEHFVDLELMQYVGLKDADGKEIYEGDYIRFTDFDSNQGYEGEVAFKGGAFCMLHKIEGAMRNVIMATMLDVDGYIEIVGNVYENKNLLEENQID